MPCYVDVALPLPLEELFTYHVPPQLVDGAEPGMRAVVQFRRDTLTGVIVREHDPETHGPVDFRTKPLLDLPDPEPVFDAAMMRLTKWVADYYLASWGETLRTALPQGIAQKSRWVVRTADSAPLAVAALLAGRAPAQAKLLKLIADRGEMSLGQLRHAYGGDAFRPALRSLEAERHVVVTDEGQDAEVGIKTERTLRLAAPHIEPTPDNYGRLGPEQTRLLEGLYATGASVPMALVRQAWNISYGTVNRLAKRGIVVIGEDVVVREPDFGEIEPEIHHRLTDHQRHALVLIRSHLDAGTFAAILCHGVTGSGKTRVYLDAIEPVIAEGGGAIVLVPEISLTPQTVRRFKSRFGELVAVLHSRLSVGERYDAWRRLRSGEQRVAVGPRSAVFAPVQRLRLIVVDEEHDGSYKQDDPDPRYHARDVAVVRAQYSDAVVVLGSATPSLESLDNAERGKYEKVQLPERVDGRPMPEVRLVDMRLERARNNWSSLSYDLRQEISARIARSEQVVILQNRRGHSPIVQCVECGDIIGCRDCNVTMTYHQAENRLKCHYCGDVQRVPESCPSCGKPMKYLGTGTQKVQDHLLASYPDVPLIRMDQDTTRMRNAHHRLLEQFRQGQAQILLGTQMVSKGLDFPNVTLVGVISADIGLNLAGDFRAAERTFQLLTQVAGRTGRGKQLGKVIVQTYQPDHPAIRAAQKHDVDAFASKELEDRQSHGYPPYGRLVLCQVRGTDLERTEAGADHLGRIARSLAPESVEVLGPTDAPIPKLRRHWRFHLILKGANSATLRAVARELRMRFNTLPESRNLQLSLDVDPMTML